MNNIYDVLIVGGGPAGLTASIYCKRAGKSVAIFEKSIFGGKITESPVVENIPGFKKISGIDFGMAMEEQSEELGANHIYSGVKCVGIIDGIVQVVTEDEDIYLGRTCIIATGTKNRTLGLQNEDKYIGKGISFCVTCDGAFYRGKKVGVIGGGNSAVTEALELSKIAKQVIIFQDLPTLTAEEKLIEQVKRTKNIEVITNTKITSYCEDDQENFSGIIYNNSTFISLDGIFIAIGLIPQNEIFKTIVKLDKYGFIIVDDSQCAGKNIYACGDCTANSIKQVTVACGEGAIAATAIIKYLNKNS